MWGPTRWPENSSHATSCVERALRSGRTPPAAQQPTRGPGRLSRKPGLRQRPGAARSVRGRGASRDGRRRSGSGAGPGAGRRAEAASGIVQGTQPWNIKGEMLVLDVGSLSFQGNHPVGPPIGQPETCAAYCLATPGCTGWTFCNSADGCGSGCSDYVKGNPQLTTPPNDNPTLPSGSWFKMGAIKSFGPWGSTSGCLSTCATDSQGKWTCTPTAKWPRGMCSLKKVPEPSKPEFWSQNAGEGWISGWVQLPQECASGDVSGQTCDRCLASKNPSACLSCARSDRMARRSLLESVRAGSYALAPADGCAACYNSTTPDKCVACLHGQAPCSACALQQSSSFDVPACVDCVTARGGAYTQTCTACSALAGTAGAVSKCMSCIARASKVACSASGYPAACWNPELNGASVCATCASKAADFEACASCAERKPYTDDCQGCASLAGADEQKRCYECARKAASPYTGCYDCASYLNDPQARQQCYDCLTNPATTAAGKAWCFGCQNWCSAGGFQARAGCNACLTKPHDNYLQACACKS